MKVSIVIDGRMVEGIKPSAIKFNISNADPLKFSERTVTYSAQVDVPRTAVNDKIFKSERAPHVFTRKNVYVCQVAFDGLPAPIGGGIFKARVTADLDGYKLELIEQFTKLSEVGRYLGALTPVTQFVAGYSSTHSYSAALLRLFGNVTIPVQYNGSIPLDMRFHATNRKILASEVVGTTFEMAYSIAYNGAAGTEYPRNEMFITDIDTATVLARFTSTTFTCRIDRDASNVIMPAGSTATMQIVLSGTSSFSIDLVPSGTNSDGTVNYQPATNVQFTTVGANNTVQLKGALKWLNGTQAIPASNVPVEEAVILSFTVTKASVPTAELEYSSNIGFTKAFDIVQAYCKAFCWTYEFNTKLNSLVLREFISPSAIANPNSADRRRWDGKIDPSSVVVSEIEGIGRSLGYKVGELEFRFRVYDGAVDNEADGAESAFKVKAQSVEGGRMSGGGRAADGEQAVMVQTTNHAFDFSYFSGNRSYRKKINDYYKLFSKGYQVKCKATLSWFDIKNFKNDAIYLVSELNAWFYVKGISNWNPENGSCNLTLVSLAI